MDKLTTEPLRFALNTEHEHSAVCAPIPEHAYCRARVSSFALVDHAGQAYDFSLSYPMSTFVKHKTKSRKLKAGQFFKQVLNQSVLEVHFDLSLSNKGHLSGTVGSSVPSVIDHVVVILEILVDDKK